MTYRDLRQMYNAQCELTDELVSERDMARQRIAELERELAAAQATIEQTRSVLEGCLDEFGFVSARYHSKIVKALALPSDRTALDAMLKEAEKRGEQRAAGMQKAYERFSDVVDRQAAERSE